MFVWCHLASCLRLGSVGGGIFLFWWRSISFPGPYCFLIEFLSWEKEPLSATVVIIDSDKALVNKPNEWIRFNQWTPKTRGYILIDCCEIYPYYVYDLFTWKGKCSGGCYFHMIFLNHDLNCRCLFYIFSLRFLGSKFLINLRRQFRVGKTLVYVEIFGYTFCGIYRLFILYLKLQFPKSVIYALVCSFIKTSCAKWLND